MITPELVSCIKDLQIKGETREAIEKTLLTAGWSASDIAEGFTSVGGTSLPPNLISNPAPTGGYKVPAHKLMGKVLLVLVILLLAGGTAFAYLKKIGPFAVTAMYTEQNLFSGILAKSALINTSAYSISGALDVGPRDSDAKPFTVEVPDEEALLKKYENDAERAQDVQGILNSLNYSDIVYYNNESHHVYPNTLQGIKKATYSYDNFSLTDPATSQPYSYTLTEGGKNFALKITFETSDAISAIRKSYNYSETTTPITGRTVTFTKDSRSYIYLSSTPPEPLFVSLSKVAKSFPAELKVDLTLSAQTDWQAGDLADWTFNLDANGDFGDLQYKVNVDALKKDKDYYFRINNIPSIILGMFSNAKGVWVKVTPKEESEDDAYNYDYNYLSSVSEGIAETEKSYKENRAELVDLLRKAAQFADEEKLILFKNKPSKETKNERELYRYDLKINKVAILPFYQKLVAEAAKTKSYNSIFEDTGLVEYLQSSEFAAVFDYYQNNTTFTMWVDKEGFPAIIEYKFRLVPSDIAEQLKDKQANLIFTITIKDINKPVNIQAPKDAKSVEEIGGSALQDARDKGTNAAIKANLSAMRTGAEIYYDSHNSYGQVSSSGSCTVAGSLFTDKEMARMITSINKSLKEKNMPSMVCYGNSTAWAAEASLVETDTEKGYWCVDSTGVSKKTTKLISGNSCK